MYVFLLKGVLNHVQSILSGFLWSGPTSGCHHKVSWIDVVYQLKRRVLVSRIYSIGNKLQFFFNFGETLKAQRNRFGFVGVNHHSPEVIGGETRFCIASTSIGTSCLSLLVVDKSRLRSRDVTYGRIDEGLNIGNVPKFPSDACEGTSFIEEPTTEVSDPDMVNRIVATFDSSSMCLSPLSAWVVSVFRFRRKSVSLEVDLL